eukprot:CAMPEP_0172408176 /NCGR_PEP_ID=MMETSP1061-20121228/75719_1 /TAXON_ID=37318 /ORGANISM="Pseudo-nitzschia pungens, Strain cf. pungens" /LENGTH=1315 /DNA_ID=CAMNT_0013144297 /DNA_START=107 /DNA_END=4054 /DNA_ORIENTATION=-
MHGVRSSDEHRYHALPPDEEAGMDAVWDQLNDEQSREVQQHESRFQTGDPYGRDNPVSIAWSMAHQTANNAGDALLQTAHKARLAVRDWGASNSQDPNNYNYHPYHGTRGVGRARNNHYSNNNGTIGDEFDLQFGISDLLRRGGESSLSLEAEEANHRRPVGNKQPLGGLPSPANREKKQDEEVPAQPLQGYPFVVLKEGRDVPGRSDYLFHNNERDRWGMVGNLDVFLTHLYRYYYHRGLTPMLCSFLVETSCLLFTIWLTRLLLTGVDWPKLLAMNCEDIIDGESRGSSRGERHDDDAVGNVCYSHLSDYARIDPLSWTSYLLIQGYTILLLAYASFRIWVFYQDFFGHAIQCRTILHDKLGLSERKLQGGALSWNDVVTKLVEGQESGSYKIIHHYNHTQRNTPNDIAQNSCPPVQHSNHNNTREREQPSAATNATEGANKPPAAPPSAAFNLPRNPSKLQDNPNSLLDPLQIAQRIMRKENYMIAFWNAGLLECTKVVFPWSSNNGTQRHYWCGVLEWSFYQCVLNFMFNHKYELRPAFCLDSDALKRRLKVCGIVHLCLLPFLLVFVVLHFFLRHVYVAKTSSSSASDDGAMGPQRWSSAAAWQFREFNELPHAFEKRMEPSYKDAIEYCKLFGTSEYLAAIGRLLVFFGGAIGGILLVLGVVVNDGFLLHVQLWGRNLVWYAGMSGIVYSIGKALKPAKEATPSVAKNLFEDMDVALKKVSKHTHYHPDHWKDRGWDSKVYASFKTMFDSEVKLFLHELVALVLTPYILYFRLSEKASEICEFCLISKAKLVLSTDTSTTSGGVIAGDVCGFSTFDFDTFGDEIWEGRTLGRSAMLERQRQEQQSGGESLTQSIMRTGNLEDATRLHPKPRARHGKMEKSFFSFQEAHPNWDSCFPPSGQSLVHRLEEYRLSTEQAMMARERQLHVQAAARQLEILARIEEENNANSRDNANVHHHSQIGLPTTSMHWNNVPQGKTKIRPADAGAGSQSQSTSFSSPPPTNGVHRNEQPKQQHPQPKQQLQTESQHQSMSIQSLQSPVSHSSSLPSSIHNALRPYTENLSTHIEHISSERNSAAPISVPLSPPRSTSIHRQAKAGNDDAGRLRRDDSSIPMIDPRSAESRLFDAPNDPSVPTNTESPRLQSSSRRDDSSIPMIDPQCAESRLFDAPNDPSVPTNTESPHPQSSIVSQSDLALMAFRTAPLAEQDDRGPQSQYDWLKRFHEHLEKQQEEVQHHDGFQQQQQQHHSLDSNHRGAVPPPAEGNNDIESARNATVATSYGLRSGLLPTHPAVAGSSRIDHTEFERGRDGAPPN